MHAASQEEEGGSYSIKFNNPLKKGRQDLEKEKEGKKCIYPNNNRET